MKIQIKVGEKRKMVNTSFKIFGCGSATPSSWSAPEWVKGKMVEDASTMKNTDTAKELCLLPVKLHYSTLAREAIKAALIANGQEVSDADTFRSYAEKIAAMGVAEPVENGSVYLEPVPASVLAAKLCLEGASVVGECMYFFAPALSPGTWIVNNRTYSTTIGCHRFYL